jgi:hypothetical protein
MGEAGRENVPEEDYSKCTLEERLDETERDHLTWEQRQRFHKQTRVSLRQLGVTDLVRWR